MNKEDFEELIKLGYSVSEALKLLGSNDKKDGKKDDKKVSKKDDKKDTQDSLLEAITNLTDIITGMQSSNSSKKIGDNKESEDDSFNDLLKHLAE